MPEMLRHQLIQGNRILAHLAPPHWTSRINRSFRGMPTRYPGVRGAGNNGEFVANILQRLEVRRGSVAGTFIFRDQKGIVQSQCQRDAHETFWLHRTRGPEGWTHCVKKRQAQRDPRLLQNGAARERFLSRDIHGSERLLFKENWTVERSVNECFHSIALNA